MMKDLHDNIKVTQALAPVAAVSNNTAFVSSIIDTQDFGATEFVANFGAVGNGTFTVLVEDGNNSALSDNAAVDSTLLLGAATMVPVANSQWKIGYIGPKRYLRVTITPAGNTGNIFLAADWIQSFGRKPPFATQLS